MRNQKSEEEFKQEWETACKVIEKAAHEHPFKDTLFLFLEGEETASNPSFVSEDIFKGYILEEMRNLYPVVQRSRFKDLEQQIAFQVKRDLNTRKLELIKSLPMFIQYDPQVMEEYDPNIYSFVGMKSIFKLIVQYINTFALHHYLVRYARKNNKSLDNVTSMIILKYIEKVAQMNDELPPPCNIVLERNRLKDIVREELTE